MYLFEESEPLRLPTVLCIFVVDGPLDYPCLCQSYCWDEENRQQTKETFHDFDNLCSGYVEKIVDDCVH